MRYPASEKLEIICLVEQSHLPVRRTLEKLGIPRATFYRWYDRLPEPAGRKPWKIDASTARRGSGTASLTSARADRRLALMRQLSPRELATRFTDTESYFVVRSFGLSLAQGTRPDHQPGSSS